MVLYGVLLTKSCRPNCESYLHFCTAARRATLIRSPPGLAGRRLGTTHLKSSHLARYFSSSPLFFISLFSPLNLLLPDNPDYNRHVEFTPRSSSQFTSRTMAF